MGQLNIDDHLTASRQLADAVEKVLD